jgi:hypothetical protein
MRRALAAGVAAVALLAPAAPAAAKSCGRIVNPYPDSRYEGVDIKRIRATGVTCGTARRVARRAHRKALRMTPPPSGIRTYRWRRWEVTGDLRGSSDRYVARRGDDRVRWRF